MASNEFWLQELRSAAQDGALNEAIRTIFGASQQQAELNRLISTLAQGDASLMPRIEIVDSFTLMAHPGAYAASTDTIYLNAMIASDPSLAAEVLVHELAHAIAARFFNDNDHAKSAYQFTRAILGPDHDYRLAQPDLEHVAQTDTIMIPGQDKPVTVSWFDTQLHIDWVKSQLPMLSTQGFNMISKAEIETDAFYGSDVKIIAQFSPYGLQTQSASHFDNNNVRGAMETIFKRWSDGLDNFTSTTTERIEFAGSAYANKDKAFVSPGFSGPTAGVENLIYRFGQISHALQDFYSHSNWVEMSYASNRIPTKGLLDSGLGMPAVVRPGDYLGTANNMMVAMSGINYDAILKKAGTGSYSGFSKDVYWWVNIDEGMNRYGAVHANLKNGQEIGALMSGAVSGAIYSDTDYSLPLRAINRSGFFEQEYFRGYSHGGMAGAVYGQWVSPIAKDSPGTDRYSTLKSNSFADGTTAHLAAQELSNLQIRNEWDRMGNLINDRYGIDGLKHFADYAVAEPYRDQYVKTYSTPGGRWDYGNKALTIPDAVLQLAAEQAAIASELVAETPMRQIEVFYADNSATLNSYGNRSYLTQILKDGVWVDSAAGLVSAHADDIHHAGSSLFTAAATQHASKGGRAVASSLDPSTGNPLATIFSVENVNTQARAFINNFDVGLDVIEIVDAQGHVVKTFDVDEVNYAATRRELGAIYNIELNARAEIKTLANELVLRSQDHKGAFTLAAKDFFVDADHRDLGSSNASHPLTFVAYDQSLPWLHLRADGQFEVTDLSAAQKGFFEIYVSVSDGNSVFEGRRIVIAVDPEITIANQTFSPSAALDITFVTARNSAIDIYGIVRDAKGEIVNDPEHLGLRMGLNAGTPNGVDPNHIRTSLADQADHGRMEFFADFNDGRGLVALSVDTLGANHFSLRNGTETIADLAIDQRASAPAFIDELYVVGIDNMFVALPLYGAALPVIPDSSPNAIAVDFTATLSMESDYNSQFGFVLGDLLSGNVIDPNSGLQIEGVTLNPDNINAFSVFSASAIRSGPTSHSGSFVMDGSLNPSNTALFPYLKVFSPNGTQLFFSTASASSDGISHIVRIGDNSFGCEDVINGDYDFDDMVVTIGSMTLRELLPA